MGVNINELLFQEHTPKINIYMAYAFLVAVVSGAIYSNYLTYFSFIDYGVLIAGAFLFLVPFQWATGGTIAAYGYVSHAIVGTLWALSYSLFNDTNDIFYDYLHPFSADYIMGLGIFTILSLSQFILVQKWGQKHLWSLLYTIIDTILFIPIYTQLASLYILKTGLTMDEVLLIHNEISASTLVVSTSNTEIMAIVASFFAFVVMFYLFNLQMIKRVALEKGLRYKWPILILLIAMTYPFIQYTAPFQLTHGNTMTQVIVQSFL